MYRSVKEGKGNLPFMVFFQSAGGWPEFEMLGSMAEVEERVERLRDLRRKPRVFRMLTDDEEK